MEKFKIGDRKGCIEVIGKAFKKNHTIFFPLKCDCGNEFSASQGSLERRAGSFCKKCRGVALKTGASIVRHRGTGTRLYRIFLGMKRRCSSPSNKKFNNYGGRGITVCHEWVNDFLVFKTWALENGYQDKLTIDRINNDGNYEPSNCRWADQKTQCNNKSNNVFFQTDEGPKSLIQICSDYNINGGTFRNRLRKGMSVMEAVSAPVKERDMALCKDFFDKKGKVKKRFKTNFSMKKYTFDQYKQMAESFNRQHFAKKIDIIRNNKDILVLGSDGNWFVVKVVDKKMREELDEKEIYFSIENEWGSGEIHALLGLLDIPMTDA